MKVFSLLLAVVGVSALVTREQLPLRFDQNADLELQTDFELDWDRAPDPDATGNYIFTTVSSLLQRWPNTIIHPGHNIVPVVMPKGTIMYHGRDLATVPEHPDWLAFDFEHSYIFARSNNGHVLTFVATRPLKFLYFDGSSGIKTTDGAMDTQDILMYGEVHDGTGWNEKERIETLCAWGKPLGVDGFVRMEVHFEVMYCDFTDGGFELVNSLNILPKASGPPRPPHAPSQPRPHPEYEQPNPRPSEMADIEGRPYHPHHTNDSPSPFSPPTFPPRPPSPPTTPPPGWIGSLPQNSARTAGKWHDFAPGETRLQIDYAGIVSFYDPALSSVVPSRRGVPRAQQRLRAISRADAKMKISELEGVVRREVWGESASGVDWASVMRIVVERYGARLDVLNTTLAMGDGEGGYNVTEKAGAVRRQLLAMLVPYLTQQDISARLSDASSDTWLAPVVHRCATTQTGAIPSGLLTPQERLLQNAVAETLHEICRRVARAFAFAFDIEEREGDEVVGALEQIKMEIRELMDWLDWTAVWVKCRPACAWDETCMEPGRGGDSKPRCAKTITV